ncbi:translation initiation factor IF-2-like [Panicum virgatum]|uniref:translation initiation factor IF-2-like n=1 Tax=Panicum virgatum TaxID=38727 RepID=UPI0019D66E02|nr:translation initiation factor IF-2-like [Panicum virgatum]
MGARAERRGGVGGPALLLRPFPAPLLRSCPATCPCLPAASMAGVLASTARAGWRLPLPCSAGQGAAGRPPPAACGAQARGAPRPWRGGVRGGSRGGAGWPGWRAAPPSPAEGLHGVELPLPCPARVPARLAGRRLAGEGARAGGVGARHGGAQARQRGAGLPRGAAAAACGAAVPSLGSMFSGEKTGELCLSLL